MSSYYQFLANAVPSDQAPNHPPTRTHTRTHERTLTHTHTRARACMNARTHTQVRASERTHKHTHTRMRTRAHARPPRAGPMVGAVPRPRDGRARDDAVEARVRPTPAPLTAPIAPPRCRFARRQASVREARAALRAVPALARLGRAAVAQVRPRLCPAALPRRRRQSAALGRTASRARDRSKAHKRHQRANKQTSAGGGTRARRGREKPHARQLPPRALRTSVGAARSGRGAKRAQRSAAVVWAALGGGRADGRVQQVRRRGQPGACLRADRCGSRRRAGTRAHGQTQAGENRACR